MLGTVVCDALMRHCLSDEFEVQHECKLQCPHTFIEGTAAAARLWAAEVQRDARRSNHELLLGGLAWLLLIAVRAGGDALLRR